MLCFGADAGRTALAIAHATGATSTELIAKAMRIKLTVCLMCAMRRVGMRDPGRVVGKFFYDMLTVDVLASVGVNTTNKRAKP